MQAQRRQRSQRSQRSAPAAAACAACVGLLLLASSSAHQVASSASNGTLADSARSNDGSEAEATPFSELARGYKKTAQTILPLLVGFKTTGLLVMAMAITKAVLLKALFLSTTALAIAALVALKKFLGGGMQHHDRGAYTFQHHDLTHVPYLQPEYVASEAQHLAPAAQPQPQVTYLGGSYGLHAAVPYAAAADDVQGLYSSQSVVPAVLPAAQLQQVLLAQQLHHLREANHTQLHPLHHQLARRKLTALPATEATEASPNQHRLAQAS